MLPRGTVEGSSTLQVGRIGWATLVSAAAVALVLLIDCGSSSAPPQTYWSDTSPLNTPIGPDPVIDSGSEEMVDLLSSGVIADLYEFGIAIVDADESTPLVDVDCTATWGTCAPEEQSPLPIPDHTEPPPGSDGNTVVVDRSRGRVISLHKPSQNSDGSWTALWGAVVPIDGSGIAFDGEGNGAGFSHLAGVVEVGELEAGRIDHALVFSTSNACEDVFRFPASKTDGESSRPDCIPQGARVQLDPDIDVASLDLPEGTKIVAQALQEYGAYAVDNGGAPMALYFEVAPDADFGFPGQAYVDLGLDRDFMRLDGIPWDRLRVLRSWDGT